MLPQQLSVRSKKLTRNRIRSHLQRSSSNRYKAVTDKLSEQEIFPVHFDSFLRKDTMYDFLPGILSLTVKSQTLQKIDGYYTNETSQELIFDLLWQLLSKTAYDYCDL